LKKTLDRILSKAGIASRTDARNWIASGRVTVNGKVVRTPDVWVDVDHDRVSLDGKRVVEQEKIYLLLYKPKGYITTYRDPEGRPTVYDLIPDIGQWVAPVGRLDQDTSGLLILTNDNDFADRITDPEHKVPKTYMVKTSSIVNDEAIEKLAKGVELSDGPTRPCVVKRLRDSTSSSFLEITITEGRNRQVRRMIEAVGSRVRKLVRTSIGAVSIGELTIGSYRKLTPAELRGLGAGSSGTTRYADKGNHENVETQGKGRPPTRSGSKRRRP
jgi:23S rRNA pseudouridine2605 synthase